MDPADEQVPLSAVFADRLRRAREAQRMSQTQLAERMTEVGQRMGQSRVAEIETPGPEPRTIAIDQAAAFARVLHVPLSSLLTDPDTSALDFHAEVRALQRELATRQVEVNSACMAWTQTQHRLADLLQAHGHDATRQYMPFPVEQDVEDEDRP